MRQLESYKYEAETKLNAMKKMKCGCAKRVKYGATKFGAQRESRKLLKQKKDRAGADTPNSVSKNRKLGPNPRRYPPPRVIMNAVHAVCRSRCPPRDNSACCPHAMPPAPCD